MVNFNGIVVCKNKAAYDAIADKDPNKLYVIEGEDLLKLYHSLGQNTNGAIDQKIVTDALNGKQNTLSPGAGIAISNNVISCTVPGFSVEIVQTLPATGDTNKIYLVPKPTPAPQTVAFNIDSTTKFITSNISANAGDTVNFTTSSTVHPGGTPSSGSYYGATTSAGPNVPGITWSDAGHEMEGSWKFFTGSGTVSTAGTYTIPIVLADGPMASKTGEVILTVTGSTTNVYDEWVYVNNNWEQIGSTEVDLSQYYTKSETNTLLTTKQNSLSTTQMNAVNSGITSTKVSNIDANTSARHTHSNTSVLNATTASYTTGDKSKLDGIAAGAEVNVQSDWAQTNTASDDYIKNKPTIPTIPSLTKVDTGSGNAVTAISVDGHAITVTKGATYLTTHQTLPKYNNTVMTSSTNIPEVKSDEWDAKQDAITSSNKLSSSLISGLATVATSGSYSDLSNKPTIPTVPTNVSAFTNDAGYLTEHQDISGLATKSELTQEANARSDSDDEIRGSIQAINGKIPSAATASNQLADKAFVNSSISTNTATFRGTYNLVSDLDLPLTATQAQVIAALASKISTVTPNDYSFVSIPHDAAQPTVIERYDRYKYASAWAYEYSLNNSSFTSSQWGAINSGISSANVATINNLKTVATSGSYNDLTDKPTIPTIPSLSKTDSGSGNAVTAISVSGHNITVTKGATYLTSHQTLPKYNGTVMTSSTNIPEVKTSTWDAKQDAITSTNKLPASNVSGLATVATSGSYNDLSNKPTIPTVPTNVSAFTNDAGYLTAHQDISGLATKSELTQGLATKQNSLPTVTNDRYLHTNASTGALEWTPVSAGPSSFDDLTDPPNYNGEPMTSETNIPEVKSDEWDAKQDAITANNKLSASLVNGLAPVATTGSYNSLTDVPTLPEISVTSTGTGNAVTDITASDHAVTVTKGATFAAITATTTAIDSLTTTGFYYTGSTYTINGTAGYWYIEVVNMATNYVLQKAILLSDPSTVIMRSRSGSTAWSDWYGPYGVWKA